MSKLIGILFVFAIVFASFLFGFLLAAAFSGLYDDVDLDEDNER